MNLFDLSGKVAVVSGAAQGMGQATALALAHAGADVALVDRNLEGANATAAEIQRLGRTTLTSDCNVSDPTAIADLFRQVDAKFGRVDFLGNIAGDGHLARPEERRRLIGVEPGLQRVGGNPELGRHPRELARLRREPVDAEPDRVRPEGVRQDDPRPRLHVGAVDRLDPVAPVVAEDPGLRHLARLEAGIALSHLIRRFPDVALDGEVHWRDRLTIRGVDRLPVALR